MNERTMNGAELITAERRRQVHEEGFSTRRDADIYLELELLRAAVCYASVPVVRLESPGEAEGFVNTPPYQLWPWAPEWWKPGTDIQCLIKAGALIAAEIDRRIEAEATE